jgi:O-antigen/teichoic acid export membrane protein
MVWAAMAIALPMTLLSGWLLTILFGEAYRDAGPVLSVHIWAGVFVFLGVASSKWLITEGLQKYSAINALIGAVANVLLNLLLIPKYGICGAAISTVLSQSIASHFVNFLFQDTRKNFYRMSRALISYK